MRPTLKIDLKNRFRSQLWFGNLLVSHGNNGLEKVELKTIGKRTVAVLTLTGMNVTIQNSRCPEEHRYGKIQQAFGDRQRLSKLRLVCDLLEISPRACDGCAMRPQGYAIPARRRPVVGLIEADKAPA